MFLDPTCHPGFIPGRHRHTTLNVILEARRADRIHSFLLNKNRFLLLAGAFFIMMPMNDKTAKIEEKFYADSNDYKMKYFAKPLPLYRTTRAARASSWLMRVGHLPLFIS